MRVEHSHAFMYVFEWMIYQQQFVDMFQQFVQCVQICLQSQRCLTTLQTRQIAGAIDLNVKAVPINFLWKSATMNER